MTPLPTFVGQPPVQGGLQNTKPLPFPPMVQLISAVETLGVDLLDNLNGLTPLNIGEEKETPKPDGFGVAFRELIPTEKAPPFQSALPTIETVKGPTQNADNTDAPVVAAAFHKELPDLPAVQTMTMIADHTKAPVAQQVVDGLPPDKLLPEHSGVRVAAGYAAETSALPRQNKTTNISSMVKIKAPVGPVSVSLAKDNLNTVSAESASPVLADMTFTKNIRSPLEPDVQSVPSATSDAPDKQAKEGVLAEKQNVQILQTPLRDNPVLPNLSTLESFEPKEPVTVNTRKQAGTFTAPPTSPVTQLDSAPEVTVFNPERKVDRQLLPTVQALETLSTPKVAPKTVPTIESGAQATRTTPETIQAPTEMTLKLDPAIKSGENLQAIENTYRQPLMPTVMRGPESPNVRPPIGDISSPQTKFSTKVKIPDTPTQPTTGTIAPPPAMPEPSTRLDLEPVQHGLTFQPTVKPEASQLATATQTQSSIPKNVAVQIAQASFAEGGRAVEIALDPVELGKVRLTLHTSDVGINVQILADRPETIDLMRRNSHLLEAEFEKLGFQDIGFDFAQNQQSNTPEETDDQFAWKGENGVLPDGEAVPLQTYFRVIPEGGGLDLRL